MSATSSELARLRARLEASGVRPTSKRLQLARLLFRGPHRHVEAEEFWREAEDAGVDVSLATVYNTLNGFVQAGLLRTVDLPSSRAVFDTNTTHHHHALDVTTGDIRDLPSDAVQVTLSGLGLDEQQLEGIDVLVRVRS